ncbi:MAG: glycosyltransferase [Verrucomicrobia bacterium]|nr:glycosyltransferase [Verrucomicrobiota bacterium]
MLPKVHIAVTGLQGEAVFSEPFDLLATELAPRLCERGHRVTLYRAAQSGPTCPARPPGLNEAALPGTEATLGRSLTTNLFGTIQACLGSADVLLQVHAGGGWFQWFPHLLGRRIVLQVAGLDALDRRHGPVADAWLRHAATVGCRLASRVVVESEHARRIYERRFGKPCELISYGANLISSTNPALLAPLGLIAGGYYLCVAELLGLERIELIAEGGMRSGTLRPIVVAARQEWPLDHPASESNLTQVTQERLGKSTKVVRVPPDSALWRELLVHAFAYIHSDPPGRPHPMILNALGGGACVLAEDTPYAREVLAEGAYGLFWTASPRNVAEQIRQLEHNPALPERFRQLAKRRIQERYSWDRITDEYERLLVQVCSESARPTERES